MDAGQFIPVWLQTFKDQDIVNRIVKCDNRFGWTELMCFEDLCNVAVEQKVASTTILRVQDFEFQWKVREEKVT